MTMMLQTDNKWILYLTGVLLQLLHPPPRRAKTRLGIDSKNRRCRDRDRGHGRGRGRHHHRLFDDVLDQDRRP